MHAVCSGKVIAQIGFHYNFLWFLFVIFTFTVYNYSLLTHDLISMPRLYVRHPDNEVYGTATLLQVQHTDTLLVYHIPT